MIKRLPRFEGSLGPKSDKEKPGSEPRSIVECLMLVYLISLISVESAILSTWVVNEILDKF